MSAAVAQPDPLHAPSPCRGLDITWIGLTGEQVGVEQIAKPSEWEFVQEWAATTTAW